MSKQKHVIGFIALTIAMFMGTLDSTIINIALPDIAKYFKSTLKDTSWISTIYVLGLSVFMITASKLADQFGRKKVMMFGLALFGVSSALCGLSNSLMFLIVMRFIQGIGGAIITPIVVPMGLEIFGKEKTQVVAGAIGAVTALAAAGGPPIGGLLIEYINWKAIFFVNIPFALISIVLTALFIGESYDKTISKNIDWIGMLLLTGTLFFLTFALLKGNDYSWKSPLIASMFIGSIVTLALFILTESKVKAPMVELSLFRESTFTASSVSYLITGFGIASPILIFNYFLQNALGYEPLSAAYIVMVLSLTVIVSMPLGSAVTGKLGARAVNFLGILLMGAGVFLLSRLKISTSKPMMVVDMIVCGFGLGFSVQSLVSSVKFLPQEKSGIGSGIVNAARQIGTCIGIALLVSVLDINMANAKSDIKNNAIAAIHQTGIVDPVKATMLRDIDESFSENDNSSGTQQQDLERKLKSDIEKSMSSLTTAPRPTNNEELAKLYDGASTLSDATDKASKGQKTMSTSLRTLSSGLPTLYNGSESLSFRLWALNSGLSQALAGAQKLNSASSQGFGALSSGIGQLNIGAQTMRAQFTSSGNSNSPSIYDGVTGVAGGAQDLSSSLNSYVSAVNNTLFLMIKNDPMSSQQLAGYKSSLAQAQTGYANADGVAKEQYKQQIQALTNLVNLYTAGTDSTVTNEAQFEEKLLSLSKQSETNQNVVTSGLKITGGATQLSNASQKVAAQFSNGGTFKNGMEQLASGVTKLEQSSENLNTMQTGINNLTDTLSQLKNGSAKLLTGSQNLQSGLASAKNISGQFVSGSDQLVDANTKIRNGADQIESGVGLVGQKSEIEDVTNKIKADKDDKIAGAFDKTFLLAAVILFASSIFGLFTDKRMKNQRLNDSIKNLT